MCTLRDVVSESSKTNEWVIIPCGGAKRDEVCLAVDLYVGSMFVDALATARTLVDDDHILILSAQHGLMALDTLVAPYDLKMGQPGSVEAIEVAAGLICHGVGVDDTVMTMLPKQYLKVLDEAMLMSGRGYTMDVYEANAGIGDQKGICASIKRTAA